jgi:hypothetical protein
MLLVDDIHTLIDVVKANPTRTYLVLHVDSFHKVSFKQKKKFTTILLLAKKVFGCLHS